MKEKIQDLPVFMSRKEIAQILGVAENTVKNHESDWGLDKFKVKWNLPNVKYVRSKVMEFIDGLQRT